MLDEGSVPRVELQVVLRIVGRGVELDAPDGVRDEDNIPGGSDFEVNGEMCGNAGISPIAL